MRHLPVLLALIGLVSLPACTRTADIANNDSIGLAQAIRAANARPGADTIRLARNGLYVLREEAEAGLLLPRVAGELRIEGNGAEVRGYSARPAALLEISEDADLQIESLVLSEGTDGAIRNLGRLRLDHVSIVDSSVVRAPAIVLNHGRLRARDSQVAYNFLLGKRRDAGTVLNYGELELERSRIHGNRAQATYPSVAISGGILNYGEVRADGLRLEDNDLPGEGPRLSFGGILNIGNGHFTGSTSAGGVREAARDLVAARF